MLTAIFCPYDGAQTTVKNEVCPFVDHADVA